jgi:hypothetical protein
MTLDDYRKYFALSFDQFTAEHNIHDRQVIRNVAYEGIVPADRIDLQDGGFLFFQDGELKMIYLSEGAVAQKIWLEFKSSPQAKTPCETLRSRAGKTSNQLVFADGGISASMHGDTVDFIEIYPPQPHQRYLKNVYRDRGPFIR